MRLTVGTTALPNLANRGKRAGKSIPLSQILAPPVTDPDSGFTSVSVGSAPSSVLGWATPCCCWGGPQGIGSGLGAAFWGGDAGGDGLDELWSCA